MPLPKPNPGESEGDFVSRCMSAVSGEFDSQDQALAVCYSQFRGGGKAARRGPLTREAVIEAAKAGAPVEGVVRKGVVPEVEPVEGESRRIRFVVSTGSVDRDNDTINPEGWDLTAYQKNPVVLWAHDYTQLPIARAVSVIAQDGKLISECEFADHPFADTVYRMIKGNFLRATSVGFAPKAFVLNEKRGGVDYSEQELLEYSVVPVPANPEALMDIPAAKAAGIDVEPMVAWAEAILKRVRQPHEFRLDAERWARLDRDGWVETTLDQEDDPIRWNRALSKAFDVDGEPVEPSGQFYKWVSRFLETPIKELGEDTMLAGGARLGAFLCGLEDAVGEAFRTVSIRNLQGARESPPTYETIQLNSTRSRSFLVEGTRFLTPEKATTKIVLRIEPSWAGVCVTAYAPFKAHDEVVRLFADVRARAASYKFLKGEAFSLSGEFLDRAGEDWADLFLDAKTLEPLRRTADLLKSQGAQMDPRGVILMGPPGTGKTLAGRVLMNDVREATFIWCSSRDFYRAGMFGGIESAYDLAAENAPSIVFIEDIDSWWSDTTVDLVKTELDGLKQKRGIVTILTTNHPEALPEALIDRPGRFHDVLNLALPDEGVRRAMLDKWAPDAPAAVRAELAKQTTGLSGAHLRELVRFAQTIRAQDDVDLTVALERALAKVREQREVIGQTRVTRRAVKACAPRKGTEMDADAKKPKPPTDDDEGKPRKPPGQCRICEQDLPDSMPRILDALGTVCAPCFMRAAAAAIPEAIRATPGPAAEPQACCGCGRAATGKCPVDGCDHQMCGACSEGGKCPHHLGKAAAIEHVLYLDDALREEVVVELSDDDDVVDLDPEEFRVALRGAVAAAVSTIVREETQAALNRARGRVD